jgi:hypothetical protein
MNRGYKGTALKHTTTAQPMEAGQLNFLKPDRSKRLPRNCEGAGKGSAPGDIRLYILNEPLEKPCFIAVDQPQAAGRHRSVGITARITTLAR